MAAYRMPAEWRPHLATYLVWPHNRDTWPGKFEVIPPAFARLVAAVAAFEPVRLVIEKQSEAEEIRAMLSEAAAEIGEPHCIERIEMVGVRTNDSWIRDYGPIFVDRRKDTAFDVSAGAPQLALDWRFNSWGGKYGPADLDDAVPHRLGERFGFDVVEPGIVLEGGSIDVNGAGAILATESCLLNKNRNAGLGREEIEDYLRTWLGADSVLWLGDGIAGDDTDGHIDDLARFVAENMILAVIENDPADENYRPLQENLRRLAVMRDGSGRPFRIETIPMPPPIFHQNTRLPASYANFYVVNGGVVMPAFGCQTDSEAAKTLARLFPGRRVLQTPSLDLVWGLGGPHCLTQQHPRT